MIRCAVIRMLYFLIAPEACKRVKTNYSGLSLAAKNLQCLVNKCGNSLFEKGRYMKKLIAIVGMGLLSVFSGIYAKESATPDTIASLPFNIPKKIEPLPAMPPQPNFNNMDPEEALDVLRDILEDIVDEVKDRTEKNSKES